MPRMRRLPSPRPCTHATTIYLLVGSVRGMGQESEELSFETLLRGPWFPGGQIRWLPNEAPVPLTSPRTGHQVWAPHLVLKVCKPDTLTLPGRGRSLPKGLYSAYPGPSMPQVFSGLAPNCIRWIPGFTQLPAVWLWKVSKTSPGLQI